MIRSAALALLVALAAAAPAAAAPARWTTRVFSLIPTPGFPAMAYVAPSGKVYEGTYDNPSGDHVPSRVLEYTDDGTLERSWTILGQDLSQAHGVQVGTVDARGRLFLLDKAPPRVLRLDPRTGVQKTWATFPAGAVPNYAAWGPDNALYVTDYEGATIWRIPAGGGTPQPWLRDDQLNGGPFGTTGIVLTADKRSFLVAQQSEAGGGAGNPSTGRILTVSIGADGKPAGVRSLWESGPAEGPDGFAVARSGAIYVALLVANQIAVIAPDGTERERFPSSPYGGGNGSSVPFDSPSSVRFLGTDVVVANQSYFQGTPANQAILAVAVGETGQPEYIPPRSPAKKKVKPRRSRHRRHSSRRT